MFVEILKNLIQSFATPAGIGLLATGTVVLTGSVIGFRAIKKRKLIKKEKQIEKKLREYSITKFKDPRQLKALVKQYFETKIKCADIRIRLSIERGTTSLNYRGQKYQKNLSKEARYAERIQRIGVNNLFVAESILEGSYRRKLTRARNFTGGNLPSEKLAKGSKSFSEQIPLGNGSSFEMSANTIVTNSATMIDDYKKALNPALKYRLRDKETSIYPMVFEIQNSEGQTVYKISDVSPRRYIEYVEKILKAVENEIKNMQKQGKSPIYQAFAYDTYGKGGNSDKMYASGIFNSASEIEGVYKDFIDHATYFKGIYGGGDLSIQSYKNETLFEPLAAPEDKNGVIERNKQQEGLFNYEKSANEVIEFNKVNYHTQKSEMIISSHLKRMLDEKYKRYDTDNIEKDPFLLTLYFGRDKQKYVSVKVRNNDCAQASIAPILAYAYIIDKIRSQDDIGGNVVLKKEYVGSDKKLKTVDYVYTADSEAEGDNKNGSAGIWETLTQFWPEPGQRLENVKMIEDLLNTKKEYLPDYLIKSIQRDIAKFRESFVKSFGY